ncbi:helix-turn-helix transcriptional regulator [Halocatena marina]|uniref:helix-turn-helix transcriptional regulator n=1 Tax=Halocatena marina TaxID=2934937 RepID=UPI00200F8911|nr:MarR family transcriptional regulator [Halocatena marina]
MVDLNEADHEILDHLQRGRCTQAYLVDELDWSRQHIHKRLQILSAAGYITKIHATSALYELISDPRVTD